MEKQKTIQLLPLAVPLLLLPAPRQLIIEPETRIPLYFRFSFDSTGKLTYRSSVFAFFIFHDKIIFTPPVRNVFF